MPKPNKGRRRKSGNPTNRLFFSPNPTLFLTKSDTITQTLWQDPLPNIAWSLPIGKYRPGSFGYAREHSVHTGVDLYCPAETPVYAVENGIVVNIEHFTGKDAESPWYNDTQAVLVEGSSGVVLYGEIQPIPSLKRGDAVKAGQLLGTVLSVLKQDKGNGTSMLHFELYREGTKKSVWWMHSSPKPENLCDPTFKLLTIKTETKV